MNKTLLLILTTALVSLTTGCSLFSNADNQQELEENAAKPTPIQIDTSANQANETEKEFTDSDNAKKQEEPTQKIAALIPPTNPDVRVRTSIRGRQDPFSVVTLTPKIKVEPKKEEAKQATTPKVNSRPAEPQFRPRFEPNFSPPPAEPTLAKNVIISGLYEANGRTQLIIQEPDQSSRYVDVGERIANGQVLVKAVNKNYSPTPLVILEQSGVEVSKTIGELPEGGNNGNLSSLPTNSPQG